MFNSKKYWNNRYQKGGNSGAGSYNRLACFKASIINDFIKKNNIGSIIDYGVGDGNQLKLIDTKNKIYTGIDVSAFIISKCKEIFKHDKTKKFIHTDNVNKEVKAELVLSCDVIYHLIENSVYLEYMKNLFSMSDKYVIIYAKNQDINHAIHVKFRKFSDYILHNLPEWKLIKHIPNKYPQVILGKDNHNTSPSDFYIYKKQGKKQIVNHKESIEFSTISDNWKKYIENNLIPIVKKLNVNLEGNIYSAHHTFNDTSNSLSNKRHNIYNVLKETKPKTILEIGFNAGFSSLLMKMILPDVDITCVDLNEHKYVLPCFNKLKKDFHNMRLLPGSSYDIGLPQLIKEKKKFDFIHIDGDHRLEGATKDMELCLKLCHNKTIILFDDTNMKHLNDLCNSYVTKGRLKEYHFSKYLSNQKYKHRFFQLNNHYHTKPILICGFPHSGTSILKSVIGHIEEVDEIIKETDYISEEILKNSQKKFVLAKTPYLKDKFFGKKYENYIKIIIARNPCYVYSSLNNRYEYKIPIKLGLGNHFIDFLSKVDKLMTKPKNQTYILFYNEIFNNNFKTLRSILDKIGFKYTEKIFDNTKYNNYIVGKNIPKTLPKPTDHDNFRTFQINQPFENMNKTSKINLTEKQRKFIKSNKLINKYFDTSILLNTKVPVYISVTSIFKNQNILLETLKSVLNQTRKPDKIYVYLSQEPYILDDGFKNKKITNQALSNFINDNSIININWVKNTGSYRKLLPLLKEKWDEDCLIITIDDDTVYHKDLIKNLVEDHNKYKCVISYRGFTPLFDKIENFQYSRHKQREISSLYNFATGKGGVIYKPQFFHKTKNLIFNDKIYLDTCDKQDDIWFYIVRVLNDVNCCILQKKWYIKDNNTKGLYFHFNGRNNTNTINFRKTIKKLSELHYFDSSLK